MSSYLFLGRQKIIHSVISIDVFTFRYYKKIDEK